MLNMSFIPKIVFNKGKTILPRNFLPVILSYYAVLVLRKYY